VQTRSSNLTRAQTRAQHHACASHESKSKSRIKGACYSHAGTTVTAPPGDVGRIWPGKVGFIPLWATSRADEGRDHERRQRLRRRRRGESARALPLPPAAFASAQGPWQSAGAGGRGVARPAAGSQPRALSWNWPGLDTGWTSRGQLARRSPATVTVVGKPRLGRMRLVRA
jgi:hypothetical protein